MNEFMLGATAMGALCISLFFLRFWRTSRDEFHFFFAASFLLLALQRVLLAVSDIANEGAPVLFLPRLAAYVLIIVAVVGKNVRADGS